MTMSRLLLSAATLTLSTVVATTAAKAVPLADGSFEYLANFEVRTLDGSALGAPDGIDTGDRVRISFTSPVGQSGTFGAISDPIPTFDLIAGVGLGGQPTLPSFQLNLGTIDPDGPGPAGTQPVGVGTFTLDQVVTNEISVASATQDFYNIALIFRLVDNGDTGGSPGPEYMPSTVSFVASGNWANISATDISSPVFDTPSVVAPVPLPAAAPFLLAGLAGLAFVGRRRSV
ncbi:MAG: VPLPA-CTERM sorting domain-containing protein [Pseudomonadota bacterium]